MNTMTAASPAADCTALAVLVSGGLDSGVLLAESLERYPAVHPLYVRCGLSWEEVELDHLSRFLAALARPTLWPLHVLEMPVCDLYPAHWSLTGDDVPGPDSPDEAVFLPGRNVLLLAKALMWCHLHNVPTLALAPLANNPFPDATPAFFAAFEAAVNLAMSGRVRVVQPYLGLSKIDVLRRGRGLPLALTFSCLRPSAGRPCGACNKCAERRRAFAAAGIPDPTPYLAEQPCSA
jgi:7-cyano-7-deazaguanine synthase